MFFTVSRFLWERFLPSLGMKLLKTTVSSGEAEGGREHEGCVFVSGQCGHKGRAP